MTATEVNLTEMEQNLLVGATTNEYCGGTEESWGQWTWACFDAASIDSKQGRGVLSSLIQKGLAGSYDYEGKGRSDDMVMTLTEAGVVEARRLRAERGLEPQPKTFADIPSEEGGR
jgi:hypothetical protein